MAIHGISVFETQEYISVSDPAKTVDAGATSFILGSIDADLRAYITDRAFSMTGNQEYRVNKASNNLEAVRYGLRGWNNFLDAKGKGIPFKSTETIFNGKKCQAVDDACLKALSTELINELGEKILSLNSVSDKTVGNLKTGQ